VIIGIGLYQGFTALDAIGPCEVLTYLPSYLPDAKVVICAASYGAQPTEQRVVTSGRIVTGAGVSAGIDLALTLVDKIAEAEVAQAIQLAIEYDPHPPFDAGAPSKAPESVYDMATAALGGKD